MITVLGIGNLFGSDDAVGLAVLDELEKICFGSHVRLVSGVSAGLGALHEIEGSQKVVIIDAVKGGAPPGTLYRMDGGELRRTCEGRPEAPCRRALSLHGIGWQSMLKAAEELLGLNLEKQVVFFGVEVESVDIGEGLSPAVRQAVPKIAALISAEVGEELRR